MWKHIFYLLASRRYHLAAGYEGDVVGSVAAERRAIKDLAIL
jgi:hypothetical protein